MRVGYLAPDIFLVFAWLCWLLRSLLGGPRCFQVACSLPGALVVCFRRVSPPLVCVMRVGSRAWWRFSSHHQVMLEQQEFALLLAAFLRIDELFGRIPMFGRLVCAADQSVLDTEGCWATWLSAWQLVCVTLRCVKHFLARCVSATWLSPW